MSSEIDKKFLAKMAGTPSYFDKNNKSYICFFKKISPPPHDELDIDIYAELLKKHLKSSNPIYITIRRLDGSPEDMPPGTIYEYYWSVSTPVKEIEKTFKLIEEIEKDYVKVTREVVDRLIEKGEMDINDIFELVKK